MTITLILVSAIVVLAAVLLQDRRIQKERRKGRDNIRRIQRYLEQATR